MSWIDRVQAWSDKHTLDLHEPIQTYRANDPLECRACKAVGNPSSWPCREAAAAMKRQLEREQPEE